MRRRRHADERRLQCGAAAHFADPIYYDGAYGQRSVDIRYYVALVRQASCRVLEYGCGNGRITLPIARAGVSITGIDRARPMLADLRRKLLVEPAAVRARVRLRRGDMRALSLPGRFGLVLCTFNTFLHLYTRRDVERFLRRVRSHLTGRGRLVFDVSVPDPVELGRQPSRAYRCPRFRHPSTGQVVRYAERFDYDPMRQVLNIAMEFEPQHEPDKAWAVPLAHRQFFPQELEALLHYNGFRVVDVHADFERRAPSRTSSTLIYHCAQRRR